ncbi:queuosine 5'-phosphate N-glycosylase/hydrolase-like isoform X2 [Scylla paramamosain]|uniref:queuosine 5'-phosphate N-glycosylase/hydrolase-like isoform X2 n=1 Tax=Scylla paramamosain TaxID=85552 RepID=UPI003083583A
MAAVSMLGPREAGKFIASLAKDVSIRPDGVMKTARVIADAVKSGQLDMEAFKQNEVLPLGRGLTQGQLANWVFLIDSLNFNFWTPDGQPKYSVTHEGKTRTGYLAMVAAVNRALDEGQPMCDPTHYATLTLQDLTHIFRSDTPSKMPLLEKRFEVLQEISGILKEKFGGSFEGVLTRAENSAVKLVEIVTESFPCFRDVASFEGRPVAFYKRAQILAADLWMLYRGQAPGGFTDMGELTMFADYRVPQSLAYLGALEYSDALLQRLKEQYVFSSGDREEVEIRGCSIEATERIVEAARSLLQAEGGGDVTSIKVDFFLWDYRVKHAAKTDHETNFLDHHTRGKQQEAIRPTRGSPCMKHVHLHPPNTTNPPHP